MTYKEFGNWCNKHAADGCWPLSVALTCCEEYAKVLQLPFFKRRKKLKEDIPEEFEEIVEINDNHYNLRGSCVNGK